MNWEVFWITLCILFGLLGWAAATTAAEASKIGLACLFVVASVILLSVSVGLLG